MAKAFKKLRPQQEALSLKCPKYRAWNQKEITEDANCLRCQRSNSCPKKTGKRLTRIFEFLGDLGSKA